MKTTKATENQNRGTCWSAELIELYVDHFEGLVCQATKILCDRGLAEECVQDAFVVYRVKAVCPRPGREIAYLRSMVRNGAISTVRKLARTSLEAEPAVDMASPSAEHVALACLELDELAGSISELPRRQSEALGYQLRGFSVDQTAEAMDISAGSVKTHRHRGGLALRAAVEHEPIAA